MGDGQYTIKSTRDLCLLGLVLLVMASMLWRDAHSSWAFEKAAGSVTDNFFIALNAKNISEGKGWGLYNGDRFVPFERELSTGPVVFLPVALAMIGIEDRDEARYAGAIVLNLLLLGFFLWRLRQWLESSVCHMLWLLLPLLMLAFMREQWYLVLGEVSASLLLLLSASYAVTPKLSPRDVTLSGLFAGMALMCKLISILCSPWILLYLLLTRLTQDGFREAVVLCSRWLLGFVVIPGLAALWHWYGLGQSWMNFVSYTKDYLSYYFGLGWTGSVESTVCVDPKCLMANHRTAAKSWIHDQGFILASLIAVVPLLTAYRLFRRQTVLHRYLLLVGLLCSAQLLFFYANGIHWQSRYYFIAGFIGTVCLCLWLVSALPQKARWPMAVVGLLVGLAAGGAWPWYRPEGMTTLHRDTREVAAYLNNTADIQEVLWLNFAPYPFPLVDLYLSADKTWIHPYGFVPRHFGWLGKAPTLDGTYYWKERRIHHVLQEKWGEDKPVKPELCAVTRFENTHYRVLDCQPEEIEPYYLGVSGGRARFIPKPGS